MPKYRCIKPFLYQGRKDAEGKAPAPVMYQIGDEVDYDGLPSSNLEPLCAEGEKMRDKAEAVFAKQRRDAKLAQAPAGQEMVAAIAEAMMQAMATRRGKQPAAE